MMFCTNALNLMPDKLHLQLPDVRPTKTVIAWNDIQTKFMLSVYKENMEAVGPMRKFKTKKELWEAIAKKMTVELGVNFSGSQIENRYKNVIKRNKNIKKHNSISGNILQTSVFEQEIDMIAALDDSLEPEIIMTPTTIKRKRVTTNSSDEPSAGPSEEPTTGYSDEKRRKRFRKDEVLELYVEQCEARERWEKYREEKRENRHRERMEAVQQLTQAFIRMAQNNKI
ncbi:uncharacterized protein LOC131433277 [Malaya genurostris]|uniref:uncharacterized protein LOC131433277 n=1 Tax=Malaya genurostris TaxID=325434 RepID=UPI0026F3AC06|nr:uncharacterized protein LOC131433277 [Malaya genurostris]